MMAMIAGWEEELIGCPASSRLVHDGVVAVGRLRPLLRQEHVPRHGVQRGGDALAADPVAGHYPGGQPLPHPREFTPVKPVPHPERGHAQGRPARSG